jgi:hypothetical protein
MALDRRQFLAAGATLAIGLTGGCTGCARSPTASMRMEPVDDAGIAERATSDLAGTGEREEAGEELSPDNPRRVARAAVENGSTTVTRTDTRLPTGEPFVYEGTVYELTREVVDSRPATTFHFTLNPVEDDVSDDRTVRWDALPAVDREAFGEHVDATDPFLGFGSSVTYTDDDVDASVLVPEPDRPVIVWPDARGRLEIDGSHDTRLRTERLDARVVAESAAYGRQLRERYAFALSDLSPGEREIVEAADSTNGYRVPPDESAPPALSRLAARFANHEGVHAGRDGDDDEPSASGTYVVRYDGLVYWTRFHVDSTVLSSTPDDGGG